MLMFSKRNKERYNLDSYALIDLRSTSSDNKQVVEIRRRVLLMKLIHHFQSY